MATPGSLTKEDLGLLEHLIARYGAVNLITITRAYISNDVVARAPHGLRRDGVLSRASMISNASSATGSLFSDLSSDPGGGFASDSPRASCARGVPFMPAAAGRPQAYHHPSHLPSHLPPPPAPEARPAPTITAQPATKEASYQCPFCAEYNIPVSIARKSDFKRHLGKFHSGNAYWECASRGCCMSFEWKSAYEAHLRDAHRGVHRDEEAVTETCPQVVWACGVRTCKEVYEASSDADAADKANEYFNHITKHFRPGDTQLDWSYSVRFRNLMRQPPVEEAWKGRGRHPGRRNPAAQPEWKLQTSFTLRKQLETRHIADPELFVKWATTLCSLAYTEVEAARPNLPTAFAITPRGACPRAATGHALPGATAVGHSSGAPAVGHGSSGAPAVEQAAATPSPSDPSSASAPAHKSMALYSPPDTPNRDGTPGFAQQAVTSAPQQWASVKVEDFSQGYHPNGGVAPPAPPPMYNPQQHVAPVYTDTPMAMDGGADDPRHPLQQYYPGFPGVQEELPSQQDVIDDMDRRFKAKMPLSGAEPFHVPMMGDYANVGGLVVVDDGMSAVPADINMADYDGLATFYS